MSTKVIQKTETTKSNNHFHIMGGRLICNYVNKGFGECDLIEQKLFNNALKNIRSKENLPADVANWKKHKPAEAIALRMDVFNRMCEVMKGNPDNTQDNICIEAKHGAYYISVWVGSSDNFSQINNESYFKDAEGKTTQIVFSPEQTKELQRLISKEHARIISLEIRNCVREKMEAFADLQYRKQMQDTYNSLWKTFI